MKQVILDTNIIVRLIEKADSNYEVCHREVIRLVSEGYELCVIPQVIIEFWVIATRPLTVNGFGWEPDFVNRELDSLLKIFTLLHDSSNAFDIWRKLIANKVKGKRAHDARIAAAALAHRVDAIVSFNDKDFEGFGVKIIIPGK